MRHCRLGRMSWKQATPARNTAPEVKKAPFRNRHTPRLAKKAKAEPAKEKKPLVMAAEKEARVTVPKKAGILAGIVLAGAVAVACFGCGSRILYNAPVVPNVGQEMLNDYAERGRCKELQGFKTGDVILQSLRNYDGSKFPNPLVELIEDLSGSELSHAGIVAVTENGVFVVEAYGKVKVTPIDEWVNRGESLSKGENLNFLLYRLRGEYGQEVILKAMDYVRRQIGKDYDYGYELGENEQYCSEIIWHAFLEAGIKLSEPVRLEDMAGGQEAIERHAELIKRLGEGRIPYERKIVPPVDLTTSPQLQQVYPCFEY